MWTVTKVVIVTTIIIMIIIILTIIIRIGSSIEDCILTLVKVFCYRFRHTF